MACLQLSKVKLAVLLASSAPLASTCQHSIFGTNLESNSTLDSISCSAVDSNSAHAFSYEPMKGQFTVKAAWTA